MIVIYALADGLWQAIGQDPVTPGDPPESTGYGDRPYGDGPYGG